MMHIFPLFDEGAKSTLWGKGKQDKCKLLLEGEGFPMEEKYMGAKQCFIGSKVMIATNSLPSQIEENPPFKETQAQKRERKAFRNRCCFHYLGQEHSSKEIFPYDAPMLAKLLLENVEIAKNRPEKQKLAVGAKRQHKDLDDSLNFDDVSMIMAEEDDT